MFPFRINFNKRVSLRFPFKGQFQKHQTSIIHYFYIAISFCSFASSASSSSSSTGALYRFTGAERKGERRLAEVFSWEIRKMVVKIQKMGRLGERNRRRKGKGKGKECCKGHGTKREGKRRETYYPPSARWVICSTET